MKRLLLFFAILSIMMMMVSCDEDMEEMTDMRSPECIEAEQHVVELEMEANDRHKVYINAVRDGANEDILSVFLSNWNLAEDKYNDAVAAYNGMNCP